MDTREIRAGRRVPQVLHRLGSETRQCPCQCNGPMTCERLMKHGAFSVLCRRAPAKEGDVAFTLPTCAEIAA
eukprot:10326484-Prorocentrum_lima.AAC.1